MRLQVHAAQGGASTQRPGTLSSLSAVGARACHEGVPFAHDNERQMSQRRQVAAGADTPHLGDCGHHASVEHLHQHIDQRRRHAGVPLHQRLNAQGQCQPADRDTQDGAHADRVAAEKIFLQGQHRLCIDTLVRQFAEARVDAVDGRPGCHKPLETAPRLLHASPRLRGHRQAIHLPGQQTLRVRDRQVRAIEYQRVRSRGFAFHEDIIGGGKQPPTSGGMIMSAAASLEAGPRLVRAPRGPERSCKGWIQEAALRMLMNNLDPEVAEDPDHLVVYGGSGKAARSWEAFDTLVTSLRKLENDETLLVQSGKPVGVIRTHDFAPRVLIANSLLVPKWATWEEFRRLERMGLTMYGQMTAGSWIYIGTQGILQGTYETFAACARRHFGGSLAGRLVVTAGLGGMGGAQPLAATMNGAAFLGVDVDPARIRRRVETRYCDRMTNDLDEALQLVLEAKQKRQAISVGLVGNAANIVPALAQRGVGP